MKAFYEQARKKAFESLGIPAHYFKTADTRVDTPYEQTPQRHAATLGPTNSEGDVSSIWEEHDQRIDTQRTVSENTSHNT